MNAEALIGTTLGTSTLQRLIGQGGMGAVYLAQQTRPKRQVAVKVLMPATALKPHQLSAFLERFRRENNAAASLEHPNIVPVYEYDERGGLAYLVMPYISGGTLRDVMERDGQMTFTDSMRYLEQMAAALDYAHARGVIHRDIKPANMLLTPDGRLLLTDFGLVKLISDQQSEQLRLTGAGAPVGTPDYMSPEQVIGGDVDGRADQYSLGVVLFHMLTGTTPFQGETPMQIASQQLHMQPPAPRRLRLDLPEAAEQVLLRALSKRPEQRFNSAQEFASTFRAALAGQSFQNNVQPNGGGLLSKSGLRKGGLFDPQRQGSGQMPAFGASQVDPAAAFAAQADATMARPAGGGLLSKTGFFPSIGQTGAMAAAPAQTNASFFASGQMPAVNGMQQDPFAQSAAMGFPTGQASFQQTPFHQPAQMGFAAEPPGLNPAFFAPPDNTMQQAFPGQMSPMQQPFPTGNLQQMSPSGQSTTTALALLKAEPTTGGNTIKLTGPVKVVQVPVAPGQYVTGLLPVQQERIDPISEPSIRRAGPLQKIVLVAAMLLLLIGAISGGFVLMRSHNGTNNGTANKSTASPMAQASATAQANLIFSDPLSQDIHGWQEGTINGVAYSFQDGAYHIANQSANGTLVATPQTFSQTNLVYQLTMDEFHGTDSDPANTFGLVLRFNQTNGVKTCYVFEIRNNNNNSQYSFFKYDSSQKSLWTQLWGATPGKEFHGGQGPNAVNTVKIIANGNTFTFFVNNQQIVNGTLYTNGKAGGSAVNNVQDGSFTSGSAGMYVNLKGTEVAFENLLVTLH